MYTLQELLACLLPGTLCTDPVKTGDAQILKEYLNNNFDIYTFTDYDKWVKVRDGIVLGYSDRPNFVRNPQFLTPSFSFGSLSDNDIRSLEKLDRRVKEMKISSSLTGIVIGESQCEFVLSVHWPAGPLVLRDNRPILSTPLRASEPPLTVVYVTQDRYGGNYSGGKYTAWFGSIPNWLEEENSAQWEANPRIIRGLGDTHDDALLSLLKNVVNLTKSNRDLYDVGVFYIENDYEDRGLNGFACSPGSDIAKHLFPKAVDFFNNPKFE